MEQFYKNQLEHCVIETEKGEIEIVHNLKNVMEAARDWISGTQDYTAQSFCDYVNGKDLESVVCMTKQRYDEFNSYIAV